MIEFPSRLNVKNKNKFPEYRYSRVLCYLRRDIFEHMITEDENNYFDLDTFRNKYFKRDLESMKKIEVTIIEELTTLGWKCKTSFGGTGLFIYSTDEPPPSCHPDGL